MHRESGFDCAISDGRIHRRDVDVHCWASDLGRLRRPIAEDVRCARKVLQSQPAGGRGTIVIRFEMGLFLE